jgi:hypothetical protein
MTGFSIAELRVFQQHFGLQDFVHANFEVDLLIGTDNFDQTTRAEKCYCINTEELFLYTLTRIKTGMSQEMIVDHYFCKDYNRWASGYHWMIFYLDNRYYSIIGHEGILCFLPFFGKYWNAINRGCNHKKIS